MYQIFLFELYPPHLGITKWVGYYLALVSFCLFHFSSFFLFLVPFLYFPHKGVASTCCLLLYYYHECNTTMTVLMMD